MTTSQENKITTKLFIGLELLPDILFQLNQSKLWKQACVSKTENDDNLIQVRYNDSIFIGSYLSANTVTLRNIQAHTKEVQKIFCNYCPKIDVDKIKIQIFPQVFVS